MEAVSHYFTEALQTTYTLNQVSFSTKFSNVELQNTSFLLHKAQMVQCEQRVIHLIE